MEAQEAVNPSNTFAVDSAVTGPASDLDLNKAGLPQHPLGQALERGRVEFLREDVM